MTPQETMSQYIDGFVFPIPQIHLAEYQRIAEQIADIWKEHGATAYCEFVGDELFLEGTTSFTSAIAVKDHEVIILGWVAFPSKAIRDLANQNVPNDPRMADLIGPLVNPEKLIFDASRMVYGGFRSFIKKDS
ncbi:MAG: DUF1428 family protein [Bacteroidota bacterium]